MSCGSKSEWLAVWSRFLDRLEASLRHKKQTETKLSESLSDFSRKRLELRNSLSILGPRQVCMMNFAGQVSASYPHILLLLILAFAFIRRRSYAGGHGEENSGV